MSTPDRNSPYPFVPHQWTDQERIESYGQCSHTLANEDGHQPLTLSGQQGSCPAYSPPNSCHLPR